jgi:hypothetical protein
MRLQAEVSFNAVAPAAVLQNPELSGELTGHWRMLQLSAATVLCRGLALQLVHPRQLEAVGALPVTPVLPAKFLTSCHGRSCCTFGASVLQTYSSRRRHACVLTPPRALMRPMKTTRLHTPAWMHRSGLASQSGPVL